MLFPPFNTLYHLYDELFIQQGSWGNLTVISTVAEGEWQLSHPSLFGVIAGRLVTVQEDF